MAFTPKDWRDYPDTTTPINQAALEDQETRLSAYTDARTPGTYTLEDDYGAPSSGSVQTALQNAITDILTVKGAGRLVLKDRFYDFASITWPVVGLDQPMATLEIVGPFMPQTVEYMPGSGVSVANGGDMPAPVKGAILRATPTSGSAGLGNNTSKSNVLVVMRNLVIRMPPNSQYHGLDGANLKNLVLDGVVVDTGRSFGDGSNPLSTGAIVQPTNSAIDGVVYPQGGNTVISVVASQEFDLRVTVMGKTIRVYVDGTLRSTYTLTSAEATKYQVATAHGLFAFATAALEPGGANGSRWSYLRVESAGPSLA